MNLVSLFSKYPSIKKINVLAGCFNCGKYLPILEEMIKCNSIDFHLQTRIENIKGKHGNRFLEMCSKSSNIYLECGIQTLIEKEMKILGRKNNIKHIIKTIKQFQKFVSALLTPLSWQPEFPDRIPINILWE